MTIDALEAALEARLNREATAKLYASEVCAECKLRQPAIESRLCESCAKGEQNA